MRRIEDDIRTLCARLLAAKNDKEIRPIVAELRAALRTQIRRLRIHLAKYPYVLERRVRRMPPADPAAGVEDGAKNASLPTPRRSR